MRSRFLATIVAFFAGLFNYTTEARSLFSDIVEALSRVKNDLTTFANATGQALLNLGNRVGTTEQNVTQIQGDVTNLGGRVGNVENAVSALTLNVKNDIISVPYDFSSDQSPTAQAWRVALVAGAKISLDDILLHAATLAGKLVNGNLLNDKTYQVFFGGQEALPLKYMVNGVEKTESGDASETAMVGLNADGSVRTYSYLLNENDEKLGDLETQFDGAKAILTGESASLVVVHNRLNMIVASWGTAGTTPTTTPTSPN